MAPLSTFAILGLAASALALPHTGQSGYGSHVRPTGTHVKSSGTGVRSHHLPSGTKASSGVRVHSHHLSHASMEPVVTSTVEVLAKYNPVDSETEDCSTVTTKVQVTVTVTADEDSSVTAVSSAAETAPIAVSRFNSHFISHHHVHSSSGAVAESTVAAVSSGPETASSSTFSAVFSEPHFSTASLVSSEQHFSTASSVFSEQHTSTASSTVQHTTSSTTFEATLVTSYADKAHTPIVSLPVFSIPSVSIPAIVPTTTVHTSYTASSVESTATASVYGTGKRGLAYNTASLTSPFVDSKEVTWAYNWDSSSAGLGSEFEYIPTLWSNASKFTDPWIKNAHNAISAGSTHLFSFNEPDITSQSDMTPKAAAEAYMTWMHEPFHDSGVKLCAPSISNGNDPHNATLIGLEWLKSFMIQCKDCQIDCINIHWYGTEASALEQHVKDTINVAGGKEIWFTEFALNGTPSSDTVSSFLQSVMPYLDQQKQIAGYAYFMLDPGVLSSGNTPNTAGLTYMSV